MSTLPVTFTATAEAEVIKGPGKPDTANDGGDSEKENPS